MQYLVLAVDVYGIPLRREGEPPQANWPIDLSDELKNAITNWNKQFGSIISAEHRYSTDELVDARQRLNSEGYELAKKVEHELSAMAKVKFLAE